MDDLFPLLFAMQAVASAAALALAVRQWFAMRTVARELKTRLATATSATEIDDLLSELSRAESHGVAAMVSALDKSQTTIAQAFHDLQGAQRAMALKALTQPSDERRKRFLYDLASAEGR